VAILGPPAGRLRCPARSGKDSEERAMTTTTEQLEANKKLARDYIDQVFNQHNL
jgi:hypothetical protein